MCELSLDEMTPVNIVSYRQNNPELIIRDCIREFDFTEKQADRLRLILLARGVNKWLWGRRQFIKLKHKIKERLKEQEPKSELYYTYQWINEECQKIAKTPRWVEFPPTTTRNWSNIERDIIVKGVKM